MLAWRRRASVVPLAAAVLSALLRCSAPAHPEIPQPDLEGVEPAVAQAVKQEVDAVARDPDSAAAWGRLGDRYRVQQWLPLAARCYLEAERREPAEFRWPHLAGRCLLADDPVAAADAFARASAIDASYAPTHLMRAEALQRLSRADEARREFEAARGLDAQSALPLLGLAQLDLAANRLDEAAAGFEAALTADPSLGQAHLGLARIAEARGDAEAQARQEEAARGALRPVSIPDPRAGVSVEPVGSEDLARMGKELLGRGNVPEATRVLREAVQRNPGRPLPRVTLGLALLVGGDLTGAEEQLREALRIDPDNAEGHAALGNVLLLGSGDRVAEAVEQLEAAVRLEPDNRDSRNRLGHALMLAGRLEEAETQLREALRIDPGFASARYRLGQLLQKAGRLDQARDEYGRVLQTLAPTLDDAAAGPAAEPSRHLAAEAHNSLAEIAFALRRPPDAARELRASLEAAPGWFVATRNLAWLLATTPDDGLRDGAEAVRLAEAACNASEWRDARSLDALAAAQAERGSFEEASANAERAARTAEGAGDTALAAEIRARARLYAGRKPYRGR